jgi:hypothetical protein
MASGGGKRSGWSRLRCDDDPGRHTATDRVRAYAPPPQRTQQPLEPSEYALIFDCETTSDVAQALRFGAFQVRKDNSLLRVGLFYEPEVVPPVDVQLLVAFARRHGLELLTRDQFVDDVFYAYVADLGGLCIGFNLPFDISRIAINHVRPRGRNRNGFSFELSRDDERDRVRVNHRSGTSARIELVPRHQRRLGDHPGHLVDVRTLARALSGTSHSLASLIQHLQTKTLKEESEEHGGPLTETYVEYAVTDPQATWECFEILRDRYDRYEMTQTPITKVSSEATIGKGCLLEMGIRPWRQVQPDFPPELTGQILITYFGGRAQVRSRKQVVEVAHCDFKSMYSTVCALQRLWCYVIASGVETYDTTAHVLELLASTQLEDLRKPDVWQSLQAIVEVRPDRDFFPVRAQYGSEEQYGLGQNYLSSSTGETFWLTLADCVASKLRTGRPPEVISSIDFRPLQPQLGLRPFDLAGIPEYRVDPYRDDFYVRLIDLRSEIRQRAKDERAEGRKELADQLDGEQLAIKITASATSYGIFIELNPEELDEPGMTECYGLDGERFQAVVRRYEQPGRFFHPLLATLITSAARLMLTTAELLGLREGVDWAFCDTDSLAFVRGEEIDRGEFAAAVDRVRDWFRPLSPYQASDDLLELEDTNKALLDGNGTGPREPLYCVAISPKRYALFNIAPNRTPILRKASARGLGHLLPPYDEQDSPSNIPAPAASLRDLEVQRWQYDLWYRITESILIGRAIDLDDLPGLELPAMTRCAVTTRAVERWFIRHNRGKPYNERTRPFGFLISPTVTAFAKPLGKGGQPFHLIAPYEKRSDRWLELEYTDIHSRHTFVISVDHYNETTAKAQTYRELIDRYIDHPDPKCLGPDGAPCRRDTVGLLQPRHIDAFHVEQIGKEINHLEQTQAGIPQDTADAYTQYTDPKRDPWTKLTLPVLNLIPRDELAATGPLRNSALRDVLAGHARPHPHARRQLQRIAVAYARRQLKARAVPVPHHPLSALQILAGRRAITRTCATCGGELPSERATYCSDACRQAAYRQRSKQSTGTTA